MYLKRLDILGFKTFASRTVFEFRPGITAIVGPNGSGKSNVADAVRWVLGEQSYAALRSRRADDIIFGGGGRRAPSGFAEVSLTIDNSDRLLPLPYNEVTITRRATRHGENEYQINRQKVRLRDIHEAIGPLGGSYTIINQGLVDAALNLRPEERRRLFEDAAEIGVYEQRKLEAARRLRETAANIQRCDDVLAELEPRLRSLKRQASLARSYRDMQTELHGLLIHYYQAQRHSAQAALLAAESAEQQSASTLQTARARQTAATHELHELREKLRALRDRLGALHHQSSQLHERAEATQRERAVGIERAAALDQRHTDLSHQQAELELQRGERERERLQIVERRQAAELRLENERSAASSQEAALAQHTIELQAARRELEASHRAELSAAAALTDSHRRTEQAAQRHTRLHEERSVLSSGLAEANRLLEQRRADLSAAESHVEQVSSIWSAARSALEDSRAAIESIRAEQQRLDEQSAQLRRGLADIEARLESLTRLQRSYTGVFAGVKAAMQWAESQKRSGFVLVSSILRTPAEIETAIEVALGSRLQNIVVERWADAEEAIEALRRSGAGRATFLPLDTIRAGTQSSSYPANLHAETVLGVAAELLGFDQHYQLVVWNLLGRTLVVRDLATARAELRTLSGGWTIVTIAGEQLNSGGALTGGAQVRESGTLRRERELRELPARAEAIRADLGTQAALRQGLGERMSAAEQARREAEQRQRQAQQDQEAARSQLERARRAFAQAESDLALQQRRAEQIDLDLTEITQHAEQLKAEQIEHERRVQELREQLRLQRSEEQRLRERDLDAQQQLNALRAAVASAEADLRTEQTLLRSTEQNLARIDEQHDIIARRVTDLNQERSGLDAQNQRLDAAHSTLLAEIDTLRVEIDPLEAQLASTESSQHELEQRNASLTAALLEAESLHGRTGIEAQRARDRLDTLWERAAADDIDLDQLDQGSGIRDQGAEGAMETVGTGQTLSSGEAGETVGTGPALSSGEVGETVGTGPALSSGEVGETVGTGQSLSSGEVGETVGTGQALSNGEVGETVGTGPVLSSGEQERGRQGDKGNEELEHSTFNIQHSTFEKIQSLRTRIQRLGVINPLALEEYEESSERHRFMSTQLSDLRTAEQALQELIGDLESAMRLRFEQTFTAVAAEFEKTFERLFGGGQARLVLTNPSASDGSEENGHENGAALGVDIIARPPGKRQQNLALLSGGERALTAGALLFAILTVNPSPFCVMDEVDAALDEANVGRFRESLIDLSKRTQFLIVTHNRGTIEAADTIYGVSMGDDSASRVLSLRLEEIEA